MLGVTATNVNPPLTIIGKDLDADATFNADVTLGTGKLRAGTIMKYAAQVLSPDLTASAPFGLLADEFDDTGATTAQAAMIYRAGTFLKQEIESANNLLISIGDPVDTALRGLGIYLELSYEGYVGISFPRQITSLTPNTAPHNADVQVTIAGTGFQAGDTVNIGVAHSLVPDSLTPTSIVVTVRAINIAAAGTLAMSVTNSAGQTSNSLNFTVT
jgi:IPT/TIG domain